MERSQKQKPAKQTEQSQSDQEFPIKAKHDSSLDDEALDDLLDEIDATLEENAQAFVDNYIQKGGQ